MRGAPRTAAQAAWASGYLDSAYRETSAPRAALSWGSMTEANIAFVARLLADPTRAAMCLALAGGEARPAGELAARAGVPRRRPATAWPS